MDKTSSSTSLDTLLLRISYERTAIILLVTVSNITLCDAFELFTVGSSFFADGKHLLRYLPTSSGASLMKNNQRK